MTITCITLPTDDIPACLKGLDEVLCDAVNGGASVGFVAPLSMADAQNYWCKISTSVKVNEIILVVAMDEKRVVGTVQVALVWQPNAPYRAEIQKVLVHSSYRRRGIACQLMQTAEAAALAVDRWLLFLDTERGSGAQSLYECLGYTTAGIIPKHSVNAAGKYEDTVIFYKLLRDCRSPLTVKVHPPLPRRLSSLDQLPRLFYGECFWHIQ